MTSDVLRVLFLLGVSATLAVSPCFAQRIELTPFVGAYLPNANFASVTGGPHCGPDGPCLLGESARQENAVLGGVRVTAWLGQHVAVEAGVGYAASGIVTRGTSEAYNFPCLNSSGNICTFASSAAGSVTTGTAQVLVALTPSATGHPSWFLAAGGGFVTHESALSQPARTDWGPAFGIGVQMPLTPMLAPRAEFQLVNFGGAGTDYTVTLGLSVGLGEGPRVSSAWQAMTSGVVTVLQAEDLMQTVYLLHNGGQENNPLLGSHPSVGHLLWYDGLWTVSYWTMPKKIRFLYDVFAAGLEAEAVLHNALQHVNGPPVGLRVGL